jgi:superfamily II DNA or RNA helicase
MAFRPAARILSTAIDADVDLLSYQLEPALAIVECGVRRVIIADEVGLGKTIQAGVVLAELARRQAGFRALLVVPRALREQWRDELLTRFRIKTVVADANTLTEISRDSAAGSEPWHRSGVWIGSADFLKQRHVFDALPVSVWDLVVIDEAHEMTGDSGRHEVCDTLAGLARHAIYLTATPHSGDEGRFRSLMALGALDPQEAPPVVFRRTRSDVRLQLRRVARWRTLRPTDAEIRVLDSLMAFERLVLSRAGSRREAALLLLSLFRKRALSTMAALNVSIARRLGWLNEPQALPDWYQLRLALDEGDEDDVGQEEQATLLSEIDLPPREERVWLARLGTLSNRALAGESKVTYVARLASRTAEPFVVFTEFRHSLEALERHLTGVRRVATLHGGQTSAERRQSLNGFLDGDRDVLIATDVAGQGLNLQARARWVVSLELPWNPVKLEQRIGRVDRIGQTRSAHLTALVRRHPTESTLLLNLARRVVSARHALGPDVLGPALPPLHVIGNAVVTDGVPPESPASRPPMAPVPSPWRRPAAALVRVLTRRRELARRWRGRRVRGRPIVTSLRSAHGYSQATSHVGVLSIPIVDGAGGLVEEVMMAVDLSSLSRRDRDTSAGAAAVRRRLAARIQRLGRLLRRRLRLLERTELALMRRLHARRYPEQTQPRFLEASTVARFELARRESAALERSDEANLAHLARTASLSLGRSSLDIVCRLPR